MKIEAPDYQQSAQMDDFALAIKHNGKTLASGEEGLKDLKIIEAISKAAKTKKEVDVMY